MNNYNAAKQSYINSVKRALYHDCVADWMTWADYLDALDEIRWHIDDLQDAARKSRRGAK